MFKKKDPNLIIENCVQSLKNKLGDNLHSCALYGSLVRGHFVTDLSDINLLLILKESTFEAHQVIARIIQENAPVDPFTVGLKGLERTMKVFGLKFSSIRRNYKLLAGEDPFVGFKIDSELDRFLCEQSLRNIRLRHVRQFITQSDERKRYTHYLEDLTPALFTDLSEVVRLQGQSLPQEFKDRITVLENFFGIKLDVLQNLLNLKSHFKVLSEKEIVQYQAQIYFVLDQAILWIESKWELPLPGSRH